MEGVGKERFFLRVLYKERERELVTLEMKCSCTILDSRTSQKAFALMPKGSSALFIKPLFACKHTRARIHTHTHTIGNAKG